MPVSLRKGENVSLSKNEPDLCHVLIGLGWEARSSNGSDFDLDASLFMLTAHGRVRGDTDFIFYGQLTSPCGSIEHTGDNKTGAGEGDDEAIRVTLNKVPVDIERLVVAVTIHEAEQRQQSFGQVRDAFVRLVNTDNNQEILRFDLSEDYSTETALIFGEIYRRGSEWKFRAVGQGYSGGLLALCTQYGIDVC
ncbi:TerD family protein [Rivihabitans pingtungensis]|uniref:Tellurium resistance protein TerD n=1 Tax=Rivihabitans pingtungensis TaxID=1054498 RepID=A0A318KDC1_9NEIS|nr:TerD family protein [Rivihabitans pingtungensis]PXX74495.1 tellurium resistance protein TerD [Rivihabitans pingtungensis]